MITLYETLGWWRRSAALKKTHFSEEWNEFHHLLIMESLGGDQAWADRFIAQHSALVYYFACLLLWLISPTLAYNFSELIEAHAVDTYSEFVDSNEDVLRSLPPPAIAVSFYAAQPVDAHDEAHGEVAFGEVAAHGEVAADPPLTSLYDVFCRIRDDEARHVTSMMSCQDGTVRARARIVELGAMLAASLILVETTLTVETVETVEQLAEQAPIVQQVAGEVEKVEQQLAGEVQQVEQQVAEEVEKVEKLVVGEVGELVGQEEERFTQALLDAETGGNRWQGYVAK